MKRFSLWGTLGLVLACGSASSGPETPQATSVPTAMVPPVGESPRSETTFDPAILTLVEPVKTGMTVTGVAALCDENLARAKKALESIRRVDFENRAALTWERTAGRLDDAFLAINNASEFPYLMGVSHPDEAVRTAAKTCEAKTEKIVTALWLDPQLARVIKAYAKKGDTLSGERARFLKHTLRDFRRNGLELSAEKQARLRELNKEITELGQRFIAEISSSRGVVKVRKESLKGLSDAYVRSHPAGADGKIEISTDYPDYYPFVTHSLDRRAAGELYIKFTNRGGDDNIARLDRLLSLRGEKANLLGYATWADYAIEPRMAKKADDVRAFLDRVGKAIRPAAKKEFQQFHAEFIRLGNSQHKKLTPPERYFLTERLKKRRFKFDSKQLEEYFEVRRVTEGLLAITSKMYGLQYKPVDGDVWHPTVKGYDIVSSGRVIGRFYLDLEARADKYKHAAMFTVRSAKKLNNGVVQTPIAALVCNFSKAGEPMPHSQVITYFHEFGHVLHHLLAENELASFAGTNTARDFVEAPSQMFEEWAWSREVLDLFAQNAAGEAIPDDLFRAMTRSRKFGQALATERQIWLAMLDLTYHSTKPPFDTTDVLKEVTQNYFSFDYVKGTHFQSSFGHLIGYDAGYYGYQWALSLAHDVLGRFKNEGLLNPTTAADWRKAVLARGGSVDERSQVTQFLGREPTEQAYVEFLSTE